MDGTIRISELLKFVLYLLGIGLGVYLVLLFKNLAKITKDISAVLSENKESIDKTISDIPLITANVNGITSDLKETLDEIAPDISGITRNVNYITEDASDITSSVNKITKTVSKGAEDVGEAVEVLKDTVEETATSFKGSIDNISRYIEIGSEIFKTIKDYIGKKK